MGGAEMPMPVGAPSKYKADDRHCSSRRCKTDACAEKLRLLVGGLESESTPGDMHVSEVYSICEESFDWSRGLDFDFDASGGVRE